MQFFSRGIVLFVITLVFANVAAVSQTCLSYAVSGPSEATVGLLQSSIQVPEAFAVDHIKVTINAAHRRIGALKIKLQALSENAGFKEVVLKDVGLGRLGNDLSNTVFDDMATNNFPNLKEDAPFTGTFRPSESMDQMKAGTGLTAATGGSKGTWTLILEDTAVNSDKRPLLLENWKLDLCGSSSTSPATPSPTPPPTATPTPSPSPVPAPPVTGQSGPSEDDDEDIPEPTPVEMGLFGYGYPVGQQAAQWLKQYGSRYEQFLMNYLDPKNYPQKELIYQALIWDLYIAQGSRAKIVALDKTVEAIEELYKILKIDDKPEQLLSGLDDWKTVIEGALSKYEDLKQSVYDYKKGDNRIGDFLKDLLD
eukprot:TRINITY_DN10380_c0_g2_i2.p1 TRINITY_DN10380_c0_g2~~TRINITY_DN10380_c0_g2_i2.p1  ORF type:complete len:366 (+),score=85.40 TRINITY_DN10380_c0_g2_i2:151-1248(+)